MIARIALLIALMLGALPAHAQHAEPAPATTHDAAASAYGGGQTGHGAEAAAEEHGLDFMHHILDDRVWEGPFGLHIQFPAAGSWMLGPLDITPTKHVMFMAIAGVLVILVVLMAAALAGRAQRGRTGGRRHNAMEAMILFVRNEMVMKNIDHGEKFAPFVITLFFFILFCNLLGLMPWGSTATANISVTAALAIMTLFVIEVSGMMAQGVGYLNTIFYWNKDLALPIRILMFFIMTPVEIAGKLSKPFALAVRLMANMTAGHIVLLAIISLIFVFGSWAIAPAPVLMGVAITFLEIFVSFLQAYIFTLLTCVFIGLMRHAH